MQQGFLLTRHSVDRKGQSVVIYWLSTPNGPTRLEVVAQQPLFFIFDDDSEAVLKALSAAGLEYEYKSLELKSFSQRPVGALYFPTLQNFYRAQDLLQSKQTEFFEGDIRLHDRYLMERWARGAVIFDGQRMQRSGYIEYSNARVRGGDYTPALSAVSLDLECSRYGELYSCAFYGHGIQRILMIGEPQSSTSQDIVWLKNERALLLAIQDCILTTDPDLIIGWNVVNFDFRLLLKRAEKHNLRLKLGRAGSYAHWRDARDEPGTGYITLPGRVVIDGIAALKTATYSFASFSLEAVSQELLGRGKLADDVDDRMAEITHDFNYNKLKLAAYNLEDCRLVWDIFEHTRILEFLVLRSQLTGLELDRSGGSVAAFTNLYLPQLHRAGYIAPNLPAGGGLASPGGYVMDSIPGLYRQVLVLDFKSLYPSIIRTFKIDPMGLVEGLLDSEDPIPGFKGGFFSRYAHFLPEIITTLWKQRDEAKRDNDQVRSQALKILMNSFYGVLGSGGCRFYDQRLSSSITMRGHEILTKTRSCIEEQFGYQVIYGDTDSVFVWLGDQCSAEEADQRGQVLADYLNKWWQDNLQQRFQLQSYLEIEYEAQYNRFLMPTIRGSDTGTKKRYAGLRLGNAGAELVFKGLESVRSDWTELAKQFQQQLYSQVFNDEDPTELIMSCVTQTRAGENDTQLVYQKRLRRPLESYVRNVPPHVRAARLADERNKQLGRPLKYQHKGQIAYVITISGPEPVEYQSSPIDYEHYIDKQIRPIADAILPFIGLSFDGITDQQMGLF